ncbi:hypothetical protein BV22DRAFT_1127245 [Leucogyrophana mollusca]|uniref:Uncharacterized protein n=1 Tax=Leucogyrophana mollusca TaxID=85980 RepID=A0ACB8BR01_9AGAM|nr:hypothetical protein BV22DRAFT_1127245 [Leucogyrophana mollusca]
MATFQPDLVIGPLELGTVVTSVLFGCAIIQAYVYYSKFTADRWIIKAMVATMIALEAAHLACLADSLWVMTITTYGYPGKLVVLPYSGDLLIIFSAIISCCVQVFFIYRLYKLSGSTVLPLICLGMSAVFTIPGFIIAAAACRMTSVVQFEIEQFRAITTSLVAGAACDVMITTVLTYHLVKIRKSSFVQTTAKSMDLLILYTIETGLAPSVFALVTVACFLTMSQNYIWIGTYVVLANVYANSLLAALNSRSVFRNRSPDEHIELGSRLSRSHTSSMPKLKEAIIINVTQSVICENDGDDQQRGARPSGQPVVV